MLKYGKSATRGAGDLGAVREDGLRISGLKDSKMEAGEVDSEQPVSDFANRGAACSTSDGI